MKLLAIVFLSTSLFCSEASKPAYQDDMREEDYKEHRKKFKTVLEELLHNNNVDWLVKLDMSDEQHIIDDYTLSHYYSE